MIKEWLITLVSVVLVSYIAKILLPNGKLKGFVSFIMALFLTLAIIKPISNLKFVEIDDLFDEKIEIELDQGYLEFTSAYRERYYLLMANVRLKSYGINLQKANFIFDEESSGVPLKKVEINFEDLVINSNSEHINISLILKKELAECFLLSEESIVLYGDFYWEY